MVSFDAYWEKMLREFGVKTQKGLADFLGISTAAVSKQKEKRKIPDTWKETYEEKTGKTWADTIGDESDRFTEQTENAIHMLRQWWRGKFGDDAASATNFIMELGRRFPEISGTPNQDEIIIKNAGTGWSAPQIGVLSTNEPVEGK